MRRFRSDIDGQGQILEELVLDKKEMSGALLVNAEDGGSWGGVNRADEN